MGAFSDFEQSRISLKEKLKNSGPPPRKRTPWEQGEGNRKKRKNRYQKGGDREMPISYQAAVSVHLEKDDQLADD